MLHGWMVGFFPRPPQISHRCLCVGRVALWPPGEQTNNNARGSSSCLSTPLGAGLCKLSVPAPWLSVGLCMCVCLCVLFFLFKDTHSTAQRDATHPCWGSRHSLRCNVNCCMYHVCACVSARLSSSCLMVLLGYCVWLPYVLAHFVSSRWWCGVVVCGLCVTRMCFLARLLEMVGGSRWCHVVACRCVHGLSASLMR